MLEIGKKFPAFSLTGQNGEKIGLKDLSGHWAVVYFYPKDMTSACSLEARGFNAFTDEFEGLGALVIGVSPDPPAKHDRFIEKEGLTFRLLSDPDHVLLEKAGAWRKKKMYGREYMGVVRSTYLLDPGGKIASVWDNVKAKGHPEAVLAKLKELSGK